MGRTASPRFTLCRARRVHAFDGRRAREDALLLDGGRVLATGRFERLKREAPRGTRVVDLGDSVMTPGLVDAHTHLVYWALWRHLVIDLSATASRAEALDVLRRAARRRRVDGWVLAAGMDHNRWGGGFPNAADLDSAIPDVPAIVRTRDVHSAWVNTRALEQVGITANTPDPPNGRIVRGADGRPTGILQENASDLLPDPISALARRTDAAALRTVDAALDAGFAEAWRYGIVGVHTMDGGESLAHLLRRNQAGTLGLRIGHAIAHSNLDRAIEIGLRSGLGDDWLRIGGVKIFSDGALGSQTAYMFDAYPGRDGDFGVPVIAGDTLRAAVAKATAQGLAVWIHAIGDRAVAETIDAIAAAHKLNVAALPCRIEHAQCVRPADARRMAKAGIIASVQPCHVLGDIVTADRHWPRARRNAYPFRSLSDAGVMLAGGSDIPVESIDPRRSLHGAVARCDERGEPAGGWFPKQRLTVEETLRAFTTGAAAAIGGVLGPGTLTPGAPADMTVWADDPLDADAASLLTLGIRGCVIGGEAHVDGL